MLECILSYNQEESCQGVNSQNQDCQMNYWKKTCIYGWIEIDIICFSKGLRG